MEEVIVLGGVIEQDPHEKNDCFYTMEVKQNMSGTQEIIKGITSFYYVI